MIGSMLLAVSVSSFGGCYPSASAAPSYGQGYGYAVQAAPAYAAAAAYYPAKVQFVAVQPYQDPYYATLIGGRVRAEVERATLEDRLAGLTTAVERLTRLAEQPVPPQEIQRFDAPVYAQAPSPQAPSPQVPPPPSKSPLLAPTKGGEGIPQPPPVPGPNYPPPTPDIDDEPSAGLGLLSGRCASCHTAGQSPRGGFALFAPDGRLAASAANLFRAQRQIDLGRMPQGRPLSRDEAGRIGDAIAEYLATASR